MAEFDFPDDAVNIGSPTGYMAAWQSQGLSATSSLYLFRASGGAIGNQAWYKQWGYVKQAMSLVPAEMTANPFAPIPESEFGQMSGGKPGLNMAHLHIDVFNPKLAGGRDYESLSDEERALATETQPYSMVFGGPMTWGDIFSRVQLDFDINNEKYPGKITLGMRPVSVMHMGAPL